MRGLQLLCILIDSQYATEEANGRQRDAEMEVYGECVDEGMVVTMYVEMWITCYIGLEGNTEDFGGVVEVCSVVTMAIDRQLVC